MPNRKGRLRKTFAPYPTCKERVGKALEGRIRDLWALWRAYENGIEDMPEKDSLAEYGLAFDFVVRHPESGSDYCYFRSQLSWGGPSDEFRFFTRCEGRSWKPYRIEYWFMDWFDGAKRVLRGSRYDLMREIFSWFDDGGITHRVVRDSLPD